MDAISDACLLNLKLFDNDDHKDYLVCTCVAFPDIAKYGIFGSN